MTGLVALGLAAGALSGVTGIGGGTILVPALIYLFGFTAHAAEGTTLAVLVPPIGIIAAWNFYRQGYVNVYAATALAVGFVIGSAISSRFAVGLPTIALRRVFAVFLVGIAAEMFFHS